MKKSEAKNLTFEQFKAMISPSQLEELETHNFSLEKRYEVYIDIANDRSDDYYPDYTSDEIMDVSEYIDDLLTDSFEFLMEKNNKRYDLL